MRSVEDRLVRWWGSLLWCLVGCRHGLPRCACAFAQLRLFSRAYARMPWARRSLTCARLCFCVFGAPRCFRLTLRADVEPSVHPGMIVAKVSFV